MSEVYESILDKIYSFYNLHFPYCMNSSTFSAGIVSSSNETLVIFTILLLEMSL